MVHTFQCLGVNIAVDVNSGAVHVPMSHLPPSGAGAARLPAELAAQTALEESWQELRGSGGRGGCSLRRTTTLTGKGCSMQQQAPGESPVLHVSRLQPAV